MRLLSPSMIEKIKTNVQTTSNNADKKGYVAVTRQDVAFTSNTNLETVVFDRQPTQVDIAVEHEIPRYQDGDVWIGCIIDDKVRVFRTEQMDRMSEHILEDVSPAPYFSADKLRICFDGYMQSTSDTTTEYITVGKPYIYTLNDGVINECDMNTNVNDRISIDDGITDFDVVRAPWTKNDSFDYGLLVAYIRNGELMVQQKIKGIWHDREKINFGPSGVTYTAVTIDRTWDNRLCVHLTGSNGKIYRLFTQFLGIGKHINETINYTSYRHISTSKIRNKTTKHKENLSYIVDGKAYVKDPNDDILGAAPIAISANNVESINGEWNSSFEVKFNRTISLEETSIDYGQLVIVDRSGLNHKTNIDMEISDDNMSIIFRNTFDFTRVYQPVHIQMINGEIGDVGIEKLKTFKIPLTITNAETLREIKYDSDDKTNNVKYTCELEHTSYDITYKEDSIVDGLQYTSTVTSESKNINDI